MSSPRSRGLLKLVLDLVDESTSLMSCPNAPIESSGPSDAYPDRLHRQSICGTRLLRMTSFWVLFLIMSLLSGVGLMTIKYISFTHSHDLGVTDRPSSNIGNDVNILWRHYDNSVAPVFLFRHQQLHVAILSVLSFCGRLLSGQ